MFSFKKTIILFLFVAFPCANVPAQEAFNKGDAISLLQKTQILQSNELSRLKRFVNDLDPKLLMRNDYEQLAVAFSSKIRRDMKNLDALTLYLHRLVDNKFARKLGSVREGDIENIKALLQRLDKQTSDLYELKRLGQDKPNSEKLVKIIQRDAASLIGSGSQVTTADVWKKVRAGFKDAYDKWNGEFVRLESSDVSDDGSDEVYGYKPEKKKKFYEQPRKSQKFLKNAKPDSSQYDVEELQFMRDFSKVQVIFRRLSESNSSDF